jgi:lauroyl/myristoyl acyltransferase
MKDINKINIMENTITNRVDKLCHNVDIDIQHPEREHYLRTQHNISYFCGRESPSPLESLKKIHFYKIKADSDLFETQAKTFTNLQQQRIEENQPVLLATYHLGAYRSIALVVYKLKIKKIVLAVSSEIYTKQKDSYYEAIKRINEKYNIEIEFVVLDAENPNIIRQFIQFVRQGYSIILYLDGNSGVGGMGRNDDKLIQVSFFNKKIYSRKGIGYLSHFLKIPVVPVISYYDSNVDVNYKVYPAIYPNIERTRDKYASDCTQKLWHILEQNLRNYQDQWEGWLYLDEFKCLNNDHDSVVQSYSECYFFNNTRFSFYQKKDLLLFDKKTAMSYKISNSIYKLLNILKYNKINYEDLITMIPKKLVNHFLSTHILISNNY